MNRVGSPKLWQQISPFLVHRLRTRSPKAVAIMWMVTGNLLKVLGFGREGIDKVESVQQFDGGMRKGKKLEGGREPVRGNEGGSVTGHHSVKY